MVRPTALRVTLMRNQPDGMNFMNEHLKADGVVRYGRGGARTVGTGGRFTFNDETSALLLLKSLPPLIHIRGSLPQSKALRSALELIGYETEARRPGNSAVGAGLCTIVLVNILRAWLATDERPEGWLGALADPHIGFVLGLMHGNVTKRWRVEELAREAGMSRTTFA